MDKGLIAVAQNDFQAAYGFFENALKTDANNTMVGDISLKVETLSRWSFLFLFIFCSY